MPYRLRATKSGWTIEHKIGVSWSAKSKHKTKAEGESALRLLRAIEHGWKPTGKRKRK